MVILAIYTFTMKGEGHCSVGPSERLLTAVKGKHALSRLTRPEIPFKSPEHLPSSPHLSIIYKHKHPENWPFNVHHRSEIESINRFLRDKR